MRPYTVNTIIMPNIGDTVRFLNDVGGGLITRIEGRMAYVEDADGFERPVPLTECVIVPTVKQEAPKPKPQEAPKPKPKIEAPKPKPTILPDVPTVALLFEPHNIRQLSTTGFDLYLVNDSALTMHYAVCSRTAERGEWTLVDAGVADPGMQVLIAEPEQADLNGLAHLSVQLIAYRKDRPFDLLPPVAMETKLDLTRLAKLHCFTPTAYSTAPVLTIPVVTAGRTERPLRLDRLTDQTFQPVPKAEDRRHPAKPQPKRQDGPTVIDLHIDELLDSTAGMQPAEILAYQLDTAEKALRQAAKKPGSKLVLIHGKGDGVLRKAVLDLLRRKFPRCEVQDASFLEYGFGATQVTMH